MTIPVSSPATTADPAATATATNPAAVSASKGAASASNDALGSVSSDEFMKLLVAQLKFQDPMNPADPTQFLAQTAQFTEVEKLTDLDTQLTKQAAATQNSLAASLVGDSVAMTGGRDGTDVTGVVTGMRLTADGPLLSVGGQEINLDNLMTVQKTTSAPTAPLDPPAAPGSSTSPSAATPPPSSLAGAVPAALPSSSAAPAPAAVTVSPASPTPPATDATSATTLAPASGASSSSASSAA